MCIFFRKKFTFLVPVKFKLFYEKFHNVTFNLLDVGCGNHAPSQAKAWFPFCKYYGIDKTRYNNCEDDFSIMEKFYCIDLVIDDLCNIPDNFFDVIILSHVIEHLPNGLDVVKKLSEKLGEKVLTGSSWKDNLKGIGNTDIYSVIGVSEEG